MKRPKNFNKYRPNLETSKTLFCLSLITIFLINKKNLFKIKIILFLCSIL